jgi:hypothetical protein
LILLGLSYVAIVDYERQTGSVVLPQDLRWESLHQL